jgi:hypothetical protein
MLSRIVVELNTTSPDENITRPPQPSTSRRSARNRGSVECSYS